MALVLILIVGLAAFLWLAPPELLRVATGYSAKIVCSNWFIVTRNPRHVLETDVQAPGNPILKLVTVDIDGQAGIVTAKLLGLFAPGVAIYRPGLGCTSVPDGNIEAAQAVRLDPVPAIMPSNPGLWPEGRDVAPADPEVAGVLADTSLTGPGMRAAVVVKAGRIVGETYAGDFDALAPLLGWSMTKTVNAILIGQAIAAGKLSLDDSGLLPQWQGDARKDIKLRDLLSMSSGLGFDEDYGDVTDVTRMLYLEPDMAGFAGGKSAVAAPNTAFNYSSGTGTLLARIWMDRIGPEALAYPQTALFGPLGMGQVVFETDEQGSFVGSSYLYATARDWARIGQFLLQDGVWNGQRLLPEGFVKLMQTSNDLPGGYSQMQTWLEPFAGLPKDSFWLEGHDGQSVTVIPSAQLVVVRLGLTPRDLSYSANPLVRAALSATQ